jgi:hypothetical protein
MVQQRALLRHGYLPKELPACFSATSYARVCSATNGLPPELTSNKAVAKTGRFSFPRTFAARRTLAIPNPVLHYQLSKEVAGSWPEILTHFQGSTMSIGGPVVPPSAGGRALVHALGGHSIAELRALARSGSRFVLKADIQGFYPSIYTHSLPWALHGKSTAKNNKNDWGLLGNRLDAIVRRGQDQQTLGLPIGPDTSFVLAELVGCAIDVVLQTQIDTSHSFRFVDDYEVATATRHQAEDARLALERALGAFELHLNPMKTRILELPSELAAGWVERVRTFSLGSSGLGQRRKLLQFFDLVVQLHQEHPAEMIIEYAMGRLADRGMTEDNWPTLEAIVLQLVAADSSCIRHGLRILVRAHRGGRQMDLACIEGVLNACLVDDARRGHDYETAWALWGLLMFRLPVHDEAARTLGDSEDSCTALLALQARAENLLSGMYLDVSNWTAQLTKEGLVDRMWLLSYEAAVHGFLVPPAGDHIAQDPVFAHFRAKQVRFFRRVTASSTIRRLRRVVTPADALSN